MQLFVLLNASSIIFDVLRLMLAKDAAAHWLLSFVTVSTTHPAVYFSKAATAPSSLLSIVLVPSLYVPSSEVIFP